MVLTFFYIVVFVSMLMPPTAIAGKYSVPDRSATIITFVIITLMFRFHTSY